MRTPRPWRFTRATLPASSIPDSSRRLTHALVTAVLAVAPLTHAAPSPVAGDLRVAARLDTDVFAWSPDGQRLAYMDRHGIWLVKAPEFASPVRLVRKFSGAGGSYPVGEMLWSPDGRQLAFSDSRPGDGWATIWVVADDGTQLRDVLPPGAPFVSPGIRAVSIDRWLSSEEIAFTQHCGTGCLTLNVADVRRPRFEALCAAGEVRFVWAPAQGRVMAAALNSPYWSSLAPVRRAPPEAAAGQPENVQECPAALSGRCEVGSPEAGEIHVFLGWMAHGTSGVIATRQCDAPSDGQPTLAPLVDIERWDTTTGGREPLARDAAAAQLSSDGTELAVLHRHGADVTLTVHDPATKLILAEFSLGADLEYPGDGVSGRVLSWSPTGHALAVSDADGLTHILRADRTLSRVRSRFNTRLVTIDEGWSPDGQWLVLRSEEHDLVLLRIRDLHMRPLASGLEADIHWSPSSDRLVLWPHVRRAASVVEPAGLERFLPPTGRDEWSLTDAQVIERYFHNALQAGPEAIESYPFIAIEYALALERLGRIDAAEAALRAAIERISALPSPRQSPGIEGLQQALTRLLRCRSLQDSALPDSCSMMPHAPPAEPPPLLPPALVVEVVRPR